MRRTSERVYSKRRSRASADAHQKPPRTYLAPNTPVPRFIVEGVPWDIFEIVMAFNDLPRSLQSYTIQRLVQEQKTFGRDIRRY
jgi:hypothetical protein